jgi:predicted ATPase/DNA-binding SARP family transcriptional activator
MERAEFPLSIRLYGGFDVLIGGQPLPRLRSRKEQWLLALLALEHAAPVARTKLAQMLWPFPDHAADQAGYNLRRSLSELRRALGEEEGRLLAPTPRTIQLAVTGADIDVIEFDDAIKQGTEEALERAIALYRGPFLPECLEPWAITERTQREQLFLQALDELGERATVRGDTAAAIRTLTRALAIAPTREQTCRALMEALVKAGESNAAIQAYQDLSRLLHRQQHAAPTAETTALFQAIRAGARRSVPDAAPQGRQAVDAMPRSRPSPLTTLVGREEQTRGIIAQLAVTRLVTLTGTGGVGKTRLAIQVAEELEADYVGDITYVELGSLTDPELAPQTVATALGLREEKEQPLIKTLIDFLQRRQSLLILDGCEHLVSACNTLASQLLQYCRHLRILATSRQPLGVEGETIWRVPSLSLPDPKRLPAEDTHLPSLLADYAAIRLFAERARLVQPGFQITPHNARAIVQICARLDGIPLAIELAAARIKALAIDQLARRLNQLFRLLPDAPRGALSRQATMEATIRWSYDLLTPAEQVLLDRLSIFVGGWTLEAAEAVCATDNEITPYSEFAQRGLSDPAPLSLPASDILDLLSRLVDRSLVLFDETDGNGRYRMLETVRQFALERLVESSELPVWSARHMAYFLHLAEEAGPTLFDSGAERWLTRLETDHDNLRAALEWALCEDRALSAARRLAAALWRFWYRRAYITEGRSWLAAVLKAGDREQNRSEWARAYNGAGFLALHQGEVETAARYFALSGRIATEIGDSRLVAATLHHEGYMAWYLNDCATARQHYEAEIAILRELDDRPRLATALCQLGIAEGDMGDIAPARAHFQESLNIAQGLGDRPLIATTLHSQAHLAFYERDYPTAAALYHRVLTLARQTDDRTRIATALHRLGAVAEAAGDSIMASDYYSESLAVGRELEEKNFIAAALQGLGNALIAQARYAEAAGYLCESLQIYADLKDRRGPYKTLDCLARLSAAQGQHLHAATLCGAVDALRANVGASPRPADDATVAGLSEALSEAAFKAARDQGHTMTFDEMIRYAIECQSSAK